MAVFGSIGLVFGAAVAVLLVNITSAEPTADATDESPSYDLTVIGTVDAIEEEEMGRTRYTLRAQDVVPLVRGFSGPQVGEYSEFTCDSNSERVDEESKTETLECYYVGPMSGPKSGLLIPES